MIHTQDAIAAGCVWPAEHESTKEQKMWCYLQCRWHVRSRCLKHWCLINVATETGQLRKCSKSNASLKQPAKNKPSLQFSAMKTKQNVVTLSCREPHLQLLTKHNFSTQFRCTYVGCPVCKWCRIWLCCDTVVSEIHIYVPLCVACNRSVLAREMC